MSFTQAKAKNADVYIRFKFLDQNLSHTVRVVPYKESYALQTRIGVDPIQQIQQVYNDQESLQEG